MTTKRCKSFPAVKRLQGKRHNHNQLFLHFKDPSDFTDLSSPHWSSEALVPTFKGYSQTVQSFNRAKIETERSSLGKKFLKDRLSALVHSANSILGVNAEVNGGLFKLHSTGTAFQVGPGGKPSSPFNNVLTLKYS
jgi:hypothetical protein